MRPSNAVLAANGGAFALLLWLYGGDLYLHQHGKTAEVSALLELPPVGFAAVVVVLACAAAGVAGYGLAKRQGSAFKGYRLLPIVAVVALFADLFVVSAEKVPIPSHELLGAAMQTYAELASNASTPTEVLADEHKLRELLPKLGAPPYLVRGERPDGYLLQVRRGCTEPVREAPGAQAVTLVYCVSPDGKEAFLSAVALPVGTRFGTPQPFTRAGEVQWASVQPRAPSSDDGGPAPAFRDEQAPSESAAPGGP